MGFEFRKKIADFGKDEGHRDESPEIDAGAVKTMLADLAQAAIKAAVISGSIVGGSLAPRTAEAKDLAGKPAIVHQAAIPHRSDVHTAERPFARPHIETAIEKHLLNTEDIEYLSRNVFFEARGEEFLGKMAVAFVTLASLTSEKRDKRWGTTVKEAVEFPGRFSWTGEEHHLTEAQQKTLDELRTTMTEVFAGKPLGKALLALAQFTKLPLDTLFYKNKDFNVDAPGVPEATRKLFKNALPVKTIGNHIFYEPPPPEVQSPPFVPSQAGKHGHPESDKKSDKQAELAGADQLG